MPPYVTTFSGSARIKVLHPTAFDYHAQTVCTMLKGKKMLLALQTAFTESIWGKKYNMMILHEVK